LLNSAYDAMLVSRHSKNKPRKILKTRRRIKDKRRFTNRNNSNNSFGLPVDLQTLDMRHGRPIAEKQFVLGHSASPNRNKAWYHLSASSAKMQPSQSVRDRHKRLMHVVQNRVADKYIASTMKKRNYSARTRF
jgi:hypothetical protein